MPDESSERDVFTTIHAPSSAELKVLGSRFLAFAYPVNSEPAAVAHWRDLQKKYHDATHHCYAFRLGTEGKEWRWNDDGEPSGTAGKPILGVIDHHHVTNIAVVVVRYFGGTKLGTGGLGRAYSDAASAAVAAAEKEIQYCLAHLRCSFVHDQTNAVMHTLGVFQATVVESHYDDKAHLTVSVRESRKDELARKLVHATSGNIQLDG